MNRCPLAPLMAAFAFVLAPIPGGAAPFDGPRATHELNGRALPLYPIPGEFSLTWAPGIEEYGDDDGPLLEGPAELRLGPFLFQRLGPIGPPRFHTERYRLRAEVSLGEAQQVAEAAVQALSAHPDLVLAAPMMRLAPRPKAHWRAATPDILLQLVNGGGEAAMRQLATQLGLEVLGPRGLAPFQWALRTPQGASVDPVEAATRLHEASYTRWAQVNWLQPRHPRYTPEDELYEDQWHLNNTGQFGGKPYHDVNAPEAWDLGLGSEEAKVAILDSGVDTDHPDLISALLPGYDFLSNDDDPNPSGSGGHGTRVAGAAAAPAQGIGVVGTCPACPIIPIRMLGGGDQAEADAIDFAVDEGAWVINNSWGPPDGTGEYAPLPAVVQTAIDFAVVNGRDGKGTAIFWAAGNGHDDDIAEGDTCSEDGYASYGAVIAVGASTNEGERAEYSELCPELDLSSPSNGGTAGITTTDIGDYAGSFGGTSAASPIAAGVGALVLSVAPELTAAGLQTLLQDTAQPIDPGDANYDANGHSDSYGYGRLDALGALEAEISILGVSPLAARCSDTLEITLIVGGSDIPTEAQATVAAAAETVEVELVDPGSGVFEGSVLLSEEEPSPDDEVLSVSHNENLIIESEQSENSLTVSLDCLAPSLSEIEVDEISYWGARILWDTDEAADSYAEWGPGTNEFALDDALETSHQIWALNLQPCTDYTATLRSTDGIGNVSERAEAVSWTSTGNPAELPDDAPETADPCDPSTWVPTGDDDDTSGDDGTPSNTGRDDSGLDGGLSGSGAGCRCGATAPPRKPWSSGGMLLAAVALLRRRRACSGPAQSAQQT